MMKLTDLTIDCLEYVFEYLDFKNLLNVADANTRLQHAAGFVFIRKYGRKELHFQYSKFSRLWFEIVYDKMIVLDLNLKLQLLRCFGKLLTHVVCDYTYYSWRLRAQDSRLLSQISESCSDTLTEFSLRNAGFGWEKRFRQPFLKVEYVKFYKCSFDPEDLVRDLFPNMRVLCIDCRVHAVVSTPIQDSHFSINFLQAKNYPRLESLKCDSERYNVSLAQFLAENRQIQSLSLCIEKCATTFPKEVVTYTIGYTVVTSKPKCQPIYLENVTSFCVGGKDVLKIKYSFGQLNDLTVRFEQLDDAFFRFIDENPTIRHLLFTKSAVDAAARAKLANSLPLLQSIRFNGKLDGSADAVKDIISKFTHLECIEFEPGKTTNYDDIRARFGNEWLCEKSKGSSLIRMKSKKQLAKPAISEPKPIKLHC